MAKTPESQPACMYREENGTCALRKTTKGNMCDHPREGDETCSRAQDWRETTIPPEAVLFSDEDDL